MSDETQNLENQLNLQRQIQQLLADRQSLINAQNNSLGAQANLAGALKEALGGIAGDTKESSTNTSNLAAALQAAQKAATGSGDASSNLAEALKNATKNSAKLKKTQKDFWDEFKEGIEDAENLSDIFDQVKKIKPFEGVAKNIEGSSVAAKAFSAALAGISIGDLTQALSSGFTQITNVIGGAFSAVRNVGMGVLGAISGGMGLLADAAHQAGSAGVQVANAWEGVAKEISRSSAEFSAVKTAVKNMGMEGASATAMFGRGPDGMAAAIQYTGEVAAALGDTLGKVADDFAQNIDSYVIANKALGIEAEAMSNMQLMAAHSGQELSTMLDDVARGTVHLSQQFGVDAKRIGKNINDMTADYATFGGMSVESLTSTAAYAAKLGIAMKDLQGITAKTDDFEGAAQAASELAGTFGMTVDTMELMNADPAEKAEMIRQSFLETGQSFDEMSRQEKARMADITGMSQEALAGAFDPENAELGLDDFNSAADAAAAGAISQEEANLVLAKSIDKVHEALGGGKENMGGPFSAFFQGVVDGIMNSKEFLALARNFYGMLREVHKAGKEVGKMFVEMFPGVKDFLEGLAGFFDPGEWRTTMSQVTEVFRTFFGQLATDPAAAVQTLMDSLMGIFDDHLSRTGTFVDKMKEGAVNMINAFGGIITGMIPWVTEKLVEMIRGLADALSGAGGGGGDRTTIGGALMGAFGDAFGALMDALPTLIWELTKALGQVMWAHKGKVAIVLTAMAGWLALQFTVALAKAVAMEYLKAKILSWLGVKMAEDTKNASDENALPKKSFTERLSGAINDIADIDEGNVNKAIITGLKVAAFIGGTVVIMAIAIATAAVILSPIAWEDIGKAFLAMGAAIGAAWVLSKMAKQIKEADMIRGGLGMVAAAAFLGIAGGLFAVAIMVIDKVLAGIDFLRVVELLAMIGLSALAVWGAALGGAAMIADGGITLGLGALGMLAGAAFLYVAGGVFALALREVVKVFDGMDLMRVIGILGTMGLTFLAIAGLAIGGAALTLAIPVLLAAVPGLEAGADLLVAAAGTFATALARMVKIFDAMPGGMDKIERAIDVMKGALSSVAGLAVLGAAFRLFMPVVRFIQEGISAAADFASTAFDDVGRVIDAVMRVPVADPERTAQIVDIVGKVIEATAAIGGLGLDMAMVGVASEVFGDTSMDDMVNMSVRFIEAVGDTMTRMIELLVGMAGKMDEKALKGAEAIAGMVGGVANLASAMSGPITAVVENHGAMDSIVGAVTGEGVDEKINAVVGAMTTLLDRIGPTIPRLVRSMVRGLRAMPEGMGEKAKAFGDMINGIGKILKAWEENQSALNEDFSEGGGAASTAIVQMVNHVADIIGLDVWANTAATLAASGGFTINPEMATSWINSARDLGRMSKGFTDMAADIAESGIMDFDQVAVGEGVKHIADIVQAYNDQAARLSNITPLNIDAVLEQVNESLRVKRDNITIADGNVTINMSLNVTMKAMDVATPLIESDLVLRGSSSRVSSLGGSTA